MKSKLRSELWRIGYAIFFTTLVLIEFGTWYILTQRVKTEWWADHFLITMLTFGALIFFTVTHVYNLVASLVTTFYVYWDTLTYEKRMFRLKLEEIDSEFSKAFWAPTPPRR